ncbi:MAG: 50S ribosomal protein L6 [Bacilli bacterium]|nr:50S ribosomal protein L6 [Bacilli bacterium]
MSRIGNRKIVIPEGVSVTLEENIVKVSGKLGELTLELPSVIKMEVVDNTITLTRENEIKQTKALHGTANANITNMIKGVTNGYKKDLEIVGVGYRFNLKGNTLVINAGYSHPVEMEIPAGLKVEAISNTEISVSGINKELVGEFSANIRKVRQPEPYKGKGIRYKDEYIRRKEGKKAA